ncbi:MAG: DUF5671 domain-containing protein [Thermomicrobiales bacterium]
MQTIRRLYVYIMLAVSLAMAAFGVVSLLELGINEIWTVLSGEDLMDIGPNDVRQRLSFALPFVAIAVPIWFLHWRIANRSGPSDDERQSWVRATYFAVAVALPLMVLLTASMFIIRRIVEAIIGIDGDVVTSDLPSTLAMSAVAGAIWAAHARFQRRDADAVALSGPSSWIPRLYAYAAAALGATILLMGLVWGLETITRWLLDVPAERAGEVWWHVPTVDALSSAVVGAAIWGLHWRFISRLVVRDAAERAARIRLVYLSVLLMAGVLASIWFFAGGFEEIGRQVLDVRSAPGMSESIRLSFVSMMMGLPFVGLWLLHRFYVRDDGQFAVRAVRLENYAAGLVAVLVAAGSAAALTGQLFDDLLGGERSSGFRVDDFRAEVAWYGSLLLVAAAVWIYEWQQVQRRVSVFQEDEQQSVVRRTYLYIVLASGLVALIVSAAFILYRLMERLLGVSVEQAEFISQLSYPLGFVAIGAVVVSYNGVLLLRDLRAEPEAEVLEPAKMTTVMLRLTVPGDADVERILGDVRDQLPDGVTIEPMVDAAGGAVQPRLEFRTSQPVEAD